MKREIETEPSATKSHKSNKKISLSENLENKQGRLDNKKVIVKNLHGKEFEFPLEGGEMVGHVYLMIGKKLGLKPDAIKLIRNGTDCADFGLTKKVDDLNTRVFYMLLRLESRPHCFSKLTKYKTELMNCIFEELQKNDKSSRNFGLLYDFDLRLVKIGKKWKDMELKMDLLLTTTEKGNEKDFLSDNPYTEEIRKMKWIENGKLYWCEAESMTRYLIDLFKKDEKIIPQGKFTGFVSPYTHKFIAKPYVTNILYEYFSFWKPRIEKLDRAMKYKIS